MRRSLAKFIESEASNHTPSLADFTTTTPELKFSVHTPAAVRVRRHLDRVQGRSRHQIQAGPRPSPGLWLPDDVTECHRRAYPSEGYAGDPDDRRRARRVDARAVGRSQGLAAAVA